MRSFKGHVRKLLRHAEASAIVEYAYNDKAVLEQRNMLTEELYGNTFQLYKVMLQGSFFLETYFSFVLFFAFQCPIFRIYFSFGWSFKRLSRSLYPLGVFCLWCIEQVTILKFLFPRGRSLNPL